MERTKNTKRNIAYGFVQVISSLLLPFIVRTIIIYRFGVDYLGLNSLFTSIISVLSLMELGFGSAVVYSMYKPVAENDTEQICAYLAYYRKIYRFIGFAVLGAGLLLMPFLKSLIRDPSLPGGLNLYSTYLIFLVDSSLSYLLFGYLTSIPTAFQRQDILSRIQTGMAVVKCVLQSLVLLCSTNFYLYLFAMPVVTVLQNLITAYVVKRRYPELECKGELGTEQKDDLIEKVKGLLINRLTNASRNSIDSMCISAFIGLSMTGMYNNYYFIMSGILSCTVLIMTSMTPSVGNSIVTESKEKNYNDLRHFDFMYMAIVTWAAVCMLCLYQPFITAWVGEKMVIDIAAGMSFYFFILNSGSISWVYLAAAGLWYDCRWYMIGEITGNVVLNIVLCRVMGVQGIVLATIITVFATNLIFFPKLVFEEYFKNGKLKEFWKDHAAYTLILVAIAGLSWVACETALPLAMVTGREPVSCLLCLAGRLIICSTLFGGIFWFIWHKSERYRAAVNWLRRLKTV